MTDLVPAKRGRPPKQVISAEKWEEAKDLIIDHPEMSLARIATTVGIPLAKLNSEAVRLGWQNQRDITEADNIGDKLQSIIEQISLQVSDQNEHLSGLLEALQYSYRIKIVRDTLGIHYRNFDDFPGKPDNFNSLTPIEQEALLKYITPARFIRFMDDLFKLFNYKNNLINFVARFIKGSLPKLDPFALDLSKRDAAVPIIDNVPVIEILATAAKQKDQDEQSQSED